jgi:hypothetical protein
LISGPATAPRGRARGLLIDLKESWKIVEITALSPCFSIFYIWDKNSHIPEVSILGLV